MPPRKRGTATAQGVKLPADGPPPVLRASSWRYHVVLYCPGDILPWPERRHRRGDLWVHCAGRWGHSEQDHWVYCIEPTREFTRAVGRDPVANVQAMAAALDVDARHMGCELGRLRFPPVPNGVCWLCWRKGRRRAGRPCVYTGRFRHCKAWSDRVSDVCPECAQSSQGDWSPIEGGDVEGTPSAETVE